MVPPSPPRGGRDSSRASCIVRSAAPGTTTNGESCRRCHQKLLVISGAYTLEDQEVFEDPPEEQYSLDEHLLERISILEEAVRRTATSVRLSLGSLYKLEQKILVNQTGITTLRDLLETKQVFGHAVSGASCGNRGWRTSCWRSRSASASPRSRSGSPLSTAAASARSPEGGQTKGGTSPEGGQTRNTFLRLLDEAEYALLAFDVQRAVAALEQAHRLDPENHELAFFLAETFFNDGGNEAALAYFERVLAVKGDHFESLVYSGVLCHQQDDGERAEDLLKRAVVTLSGCLPAGLQPRRGLRRSRDACRERRCSSSVRSRSTRSRRRSTCSAAVATRWAKSPPRSAICARLCKLDPGVRGGLSPPGPGLP